MKKVLLFLLVLAATSCSKPSGQDNSMYLDDGRFAGGHEYVDLGLSVRWATCNIGATAYSEVGDYYAWGELSPKKKYVWTNYKYLLSEPYSEYYDINNYNRYKKYDWELGVTISGNKLDVLELCDDVARQEWGIRWRMPTYEEVKELMTDPRLSRTIVEDYPFRGINGVLIESNIKGYEGNTLFFPLTEFYYGDSKIPEIYPKRTYFIAREPLCWTSSLSFPDLAEFFSASEMSRFMGQKIDPGMELNIAPRFVGLPIRPVSPNPRNQ